MKKVDIFDEDNSIIIDDQYDRTDFTFYPEDKKFTVSRSVKDDAFYSNQTFEYKISTEPLEIQMRTLENSHEPPLEYSIKDGVVLEDELKKKGRLFPDTIENLKKEIAWNKVPIFSNFEVNLYMLSKHPEIISKEDYKKFLRHSEQRIKSGLSKIETRLKEKDTTGLQILEGEYGRQIYYPKDKEASQKEQKKQFEYIENNFNKPLFDEKSSEYCGISKYEFQESPFILQHIDGLLNKKELVPPKEEEKKSHWRWLGYAWTVIVNLITIFVVLAIYNTISDSFEIIVVSILILIYLSIQTFMMSYGVTTTETTFALDAEFKRIRKLLKNEPDKYEKEEIQKAKKKVDKAMVKMYINIAFLIIVYLIALSHLFGAL